MGINDSFRLTAPQNAGLAVFLIIAIVAVVPEVLRVLV